MITSVKCSAVLIKGGRDAGRDFHGAVGSRRTADGETIPSRASRFTPFTVGGPHHRASSAASTTYRARSQN